MKGRTRHYVDADPWAELAVAVVQRAIDDANGFALISHDKRSPELPAKLADAARQWLAAGGCGLLDVFNLDAGAVAGALTHGQENKGASHI